MGLQDRHYNRGGAGGGGGDFGEGGGFRRALRRVFGEGDNFLSWSVPFFTAAGISVRIHIFYIVFVIARLIWPLNPGATGLIYTALLIGNMFLFVLLHEFGHCLACRRVGGEADQIVMWPLGGLAMCLPPRNWKANFITTICGPLVNLALAGALATTLLTLGADWHSVTFNPFSPWRAWLLDNWLSQSESQAAAIAKHVLYSAYQANVYLFLFNVFLPMYPMDGGRLLQEILWRQMGFRRATRIATTTGLVLAVLIGGFAAMTGQSILFSICFFCGFTCYQEKQMLSMADDEPEWATGQGWSDGGYATKPVRNSSPNGGNTGADKAYKAALKRQEKERETQAQVDRILDKIRDQGMQSLSRKERAILKDATERTRGQG